jgi:hypothetical protein
MVDAPLEAAAEDANVARLFAQEHAVIVVGRALGKTAIHVRDKEGNDQKVAVEVIAGDPHTRALAIGETFTIPMKGVKEYSVGLAEIVSASITTDGSRLLVTGRKPGTTTVLLILRNGSQESIELTVIGGRRS